jgi:hypothetical protein
VWETLIVAYICIRLYLIEFLQASRGGSKNHYADLEGCHNGGVIPNLNLTRGAYTFNPYMVLKTYMGMRDPTGLSRLMMQAKESVPYAEYGCGTAGTKFNLHNPHVFICFKPKNVVGKHKVDKMIPDFATILKQPHATNRQVRSTAIQALRMASFTTNEVAKVSRHRRAETIDLHYDTGLRTNTRADMAVAVGQAASLKRGNAFFPVSDHLPKKVSKSTVEFQSPANMVPSFTAPLTAEELDTVNISLDNGWQDEFNTEFDPTRQDETDVTAPGHQEGGAGWPSQTLEPGPRPRLLRQAAAHGLRQEQQATRVAVQSTTFASSVLEVGRPEKEARGGGGQQAALESSYQAVSRLGKLICGYDLTLFFLQV